MNVSSTLGKTSLLAVIALTAVLVGLAAYSMGMDRRSSGATASAERATLLASAYSDANAQLLELERLGNEFIVYPTADLRADFDARVSALLSQLDYISRLGSDEDRAGLKAIHEGYLPQLAVVQEFFDALLAGTPYTGPVPDASVVAELQALLDRPVTEQRASSLATMSDLRAWQQQRVWTTAGVFAGGLGAIVVLLVVLRSAITKATRAEMEARQYQAEALRDSLTGLGNHRSFQEALHRQHAPGSTIALLDVDRFKEVNDTRGHAEGDRILRALSTLVDARFPGCGYRIGGDEFAVLATQDGISSEIQRLVDDFAENRFGVTISAGMSSWTRLQADADLHLAMADAALRWAKREGRERLVDFADVEETVGGVRSARKSESLRRLLTTRDGLSPVFQPIWTLDGRLAAVEALTRFDPSVGFSGPEEAFDIANQDGRSFDLDMLACEEILRTGNSLPSDVALFINLSPASIVDQHFTPAVIVGLLSGSRTPENVVVEITERSTVSLSSLGNKIEQLRCAGFKVALDDVGAGNSGLQSLRTVPVDWVKVDRSIVAGAKESVSARGLLKAILAFANEVGVSVVAEGIECEEEMAIIRSLSLTPALRGTRVVAQGYLMGRPTPIEHVPLPNHEYGPLAA